MLPGWDHYHSPASALIRDKDHLRVMREAGMKSRGLDWLEADIGRREQELPRSAALRR